MIWTFLLAAAWGCANVVTPSGGPEDKTPPRVVEASPANGKTGFQSEEIVIRFNEFFKLNNPTREIYFSPPLPVKPSFHIRQKSLQIQLPEDALRANTTYTVEFGKGIRDITEGNPAESLTYTFSTGPAIDTFRMAGIVKDAFTLKPEKNVWVGLYEALDDSVPDQKKPQYVTKTDQNGNYRFTHLKQERYYPFALKDNNRNLRYDLPNEHMAFSLRSVQSVNTDSVPLTNLMLFQKEPPVISQVSRSTPRRGRLIIRYSRQINSFKAEFAENSKNRAFTVQRETVFPSDSISLWINPVPDSAFSLVTTANDTIIDTVSVDFSRTDSLPRHLLPSKRKKRVRKQAVTSHKIFQPYSLSFPYPIETINRSRIALYRDSIQGVPDSAFGIGKNNLRALVIDHRWQDTTNYRLKMQDSALMSIYGQPSSAIDTSFITTKTSDHSTVRLNFENAEPTLQYIVQLYTGDNNIEREVICDDCGKNALTIEHLDPKKYQLRVIVDRNKNRKWDPGNYAQQRQPEPVIYYEGKIEVRRNWENEVTVAL